MPPMVPMIQLFGRVSGQLGSTSNFGGSASAGRNFQTVDMFVPLISISILGLTLNAAFNMLRAWLLRGFPEEH